MVKSTKTNNDAEAFRPQICRYVDGDLILDITDMLSCEPRRHKVLLTIVEFDDAFRATRRVRHYVDVEDFKLVCHDIVEGKLTRFDDHKGSVHADSVEARVLAIKRGGKASEPLSIRIDNGVGEARINGTVAMTQVTESLTVSLPQWDARKIALIALDYIRQWETVNFRRRQEARALPAPAADRSSTRDTHLAAAA